MPYNRDYLCVRCGKLLRGDGAAAHRRPQVLPLGSGLAHRVSPPVEDDVPGPPTCCGDLTVLLAYEQSVAAKQLEAERRIDWHKAGDHFAKRGGKRKWSPVMTAERCHGCRRGRES
ncbi:MAG: hypothetical protein AAF657_19635 [Acidobacteriota bacterium]